MEIALDTPVKRPAAVLKALRSGKTLKLKYKDDEVEVAVVAHPTATATTPEQEAEMARLRKHPAFGMWANREDMRDVEAWRSAQYRKLNWEGGQPHARDV